MKKIALISILLVVGRIYGFSESWVSSNKISCTVSFSEISTTVSSNGEILSYGYFEGMLSSDGGIELNSYGGRDYYLIKFQPDGAVDWMKGFGSTSNDYIAGGVTINAEGTIVVTGGFVDYLKYSESDSLESSGLFDIFLIELDLDGNVVWARNAGQGASYQLPTTLASDNNGNIIMAGLFIDSIAFYDNTVLYTETSNADYFYGAFDEANGDLLWVRQNKARNSSNSKIDKIYCTTDNSILFTGVYVDTVLIDDQTIVSFEHSKDVHLFMTNSTGDLQWIRNIKGDKDELSYSVLATETNDIYISGYYGSDTLSVDSTDSQTIEIIGNNGSLDVFVAKYFPDGNLDWFRTAGSSYEDKVFNSMSLDGQLYISGHFSDTMYWGGIELASTGPGDVDMFTGAIDTEGNFRSANSYHGINNSNDQSRGLFENQGKIYTMMRTNSEWIQIGEDVYVSDGVSYYMVLGILGCNLITVDNAVKNDVSTCYGDSTGSIQISASGGFDGPWKYSIDNGVTLSNQSYFGDLPAGDYQVIVVDSENCVESGPSITITQPDSLQVMLVAQDDALYTADPDTSLITGGSITVAAGGGIDYNYSFLLLPDNTQQLLNGNFTNLDSGKYVVEVTNLHGCEPVQTDTITIAATFNTGFDGPRALDASIYPNPTRSLLTIELEMDADEVQMEIMSLTGQIVRSSRVYTTGGVLRETVDVSDLAAGMYMLRLNGRSVNTRIVVQ